MNAALKSLDSIGAPANEVEWTRANLVEVLPDLTCPQALKVFEDMLNEAERRYLGRLMAPEAELGPMVKAFSGRLYFNLSQLRRIAAIGGTAPATLLRSFGHAGEIRPEDERVVRPPLRERLSCLPSMLRLVARHLRSDRLFRTQLAVLQQLETRLSKTDPCTLTDSELWTPIEEWVRAAPAGLEVVLLFGGVLIHEDALRKMCERVSFPFERLLYSQLASGERSVSSQQAFDLVALADAARREPAVARWLGDNRSPLAEFRSALAGTAFLAAFDRFIEIYGHRGRYESDWSLPRYREDPVPLLGAVQVHLHHPPGDVSEAVLRRAQEATAIWTEFEQRLTRWRRQTLLPRARARMQTIKRYYLSRELCRSAMVRVLAGLRDWHLVLARRLAERGWIDAVDDYFLLLFDEIAAAIRDPSEAQRLRGIADTRRAELEQYRRIDMPLLMRELELPSLMRAGRVPDVAADDELYGVPVSRGSVEGQVAVVDDPGNLSQMRRGAILVARATDPSWTPLFTLASGVIVEVGGVLSHASTIAREYGLPALANVKHATQRLKTGDRVRLDADRGVVQRISTGE